MLYQSHSDHQLLGMLKLGDKAALNEIYKRYQGILYSHAFRRFPDREEVRDVVQDIFINLWNNREHLQVGASLAAYLYASVRNRLLNIIRHQKVQDSYLHSLQNFIDKGENITDEKLREKELIRLVEHEVAALPAQMRLIFEMSRHLNMSHQQIAEELNLSPLTVRTQVRNALRILKVRLGARVFTIFF